MAGHQITYFRQSMRDTKPCTDLNGRNKTIHFYLLPFTWERFYTLEGPVIGTFTNYVINSGEVLRRDKTPS